MALYNAGERTTSSVTLCYLHNHHAGSLVILSVSSGAKVAYTASNGVVSCTSLCVMPHESWTGAASPPHTRYECSSTCEQDPS